jgi:tRNA A-37 threonylcarbamoyl transferase component Bud32
MTAAGTTIGNYVLGPLLGRGGTSEVYAAEHRFLGEPAAIKLLRPHLADSDEMMDALVAEARRTRAIQHANVVRVFDVGRDGDIVYLVIERIDGASLADRLRAGPLDEPTVRKLGAAIADGIGAAHDLGIVHRDLKPANVMLADDVPKVVDFGIARQLDKAVASGPRMGTPAYMAPEQLTNNVVAPSVDVWALGIVLFEAISGALPFDTRDGTCRQLVEPAPRPKHCSPALERLILACLAREPAKRPPTMAAIASELRGDVDERITELIDAPMAAPIARAPMGRAPVAPIPVATRRKRWPAIAVGLGILAIAIFAWQLTSRVGSSTAAAPAAGDAAVASTAPIDAGVAVMGIDARSPSVAAASIDASVADDDSVTVIDLDIRSIPTGAAIVVQGVTKGTTPATLSLPLPVDIELHRAGFRIAHRRAVKSGVVEVRLVPLIPKPPKKCPMPPCEGLD